MSKGVNRVKASIVQSERSAVDIITETKARLEQALQQSDVADNISPLLNAILEITTQASLLALNAAMEVAKTDDIENGFNSVVENSQSTLGQVAAINEIIKNTAQDLLTSSNQLIQFSSEDIKKIISLYAPRSK